MHHTTVPQGITDAVVHTTLHWPNADQALCLHPAYLSVAQSAASGDHGRRVLILEPSHG